MREGGSWEQEGMGVVGGKREGGDGTTAEKGTGGWLENGIHRSLPAPTLEKKRKEKQGFAATSLCI
jgi:hypothetical protein